MSFDADRLATAAVRSLRAYDPGHDLPTLRRRFGPVLAELGSNENPLGPSPHALAAAQDALRDAFRYPDPRGLMLREALATRHGIALDRIVLGNGSHELLMQLAQAFAGPEQAVMYSEFGFAVYPIAATAVGAPIIRVPALPRDHASAPRGHDLEAMAAALTATTRLVYLANPNNPTGTWFDDAALAAFLARVPVDTLVVVDEAYAEYVDAPGLSSALRFIDQYPNLVVTRTFSKAHALAGLRVGWLAAHASVAAVLERLRESFNVNNVALAAATASLADGAHLERARDFNRSERDWLAVELRARGYATLPSQTNFLLLDLGRDAADLERKLFESGVIVRPMGGYGLAATLRISIGSRAENQRLLAALP
ncbi:MAG TPA: histidinol-phosphate transaminase [Rhodanobacteraceae bacterium]|nr:histidinol-phosphate transaminase [Rhodanobacteraceae bacterium]